MRVTMAAAISFSILSMGKQAKPRAAACSKSAASAMERLRTCALVGPSGLTTAGIATSGTTRNTLHSISCNSSTWPMHSATGASGELSVSSQVLCLDGSRELQFLW